MKTPFYPVRLLPPSVALCCLVLMPARVSAQKIISDPVRMFGYGNLTAVSRSPDGQHLVTGGNGGVFLWDIESARVVRKFASYTDDTGSLEEVAFSSDGSMLVTDYQFVTEDHHHSHLSRIWNVATGDLLHTFEGHYGTFSPDGTRLLSSTDEEEQTRLWDLSTGEEIWSFDGEIKPAGHAFSSDGLLVVTTDRGEVHVWSVTTGDLLHTLYWGINTTYISAAFSPQGHQLLTWCLSSPDVRLWDADTGEELHTLVGHTDGVRGGEFSPDGSRIATGSYLDRTDRFWDTATGTLLHTCSGGTPPVRFSPDGKYVLSGWQSGWESDMTSVLWNTDSGQLVHSLEGIPGGPDAYFESFSPEGSNVFTQVGDGNVPVMWEVATGQPVRPFLGHGGFGLGCFSQSGDRVLTAGRLGPLLWDARSGEILKAYNWDTAIGEFPRSFWITAVALSADRTKVAAAGGPKTLMWDATTGDLLHTLPSAYCVAFSPDSTQLLTGTIVPDNTVYLWDLNAGQLIRTFTGNAQGVVSVAFSPDGTQVLAGAGYGTPPDSTARLWDAHTGQLLRTFTGHADGAVWAVFSPDGSQVLTGSSEEPTLLLWDAATGQVLGSFTRTDGDSRGFRAVAFAPDGSQIAAEGWGPSWLWDATTAEPLMKFEGINGDNETITFSADGSQLLVGEELWQIREPIQLQITFEPGIGAVLIWQDPSGQLPCVLQQCPDLPLGNWTDVSVTTPGRYEIVNPNEGAMFYRLKQP